MITIKLASNIITIMIVIILQYNILLFAYYLIKKHGYEVISFVYVLRTFFYAFVPVIVLFRKRFRRNQSKL